MSERKIFRPSTVAITSPPTCDLQPIRNDSTRATASAAAAWAKRDFLFKYFSPANGCSRAIPARREDMQWADYANPLNLSNHLETCPEATGVWAGTGCPASRKA